MPVHSKPLYDNRVILGAAIAIPLAAALLYAATRKGGKKASAAAPTVATATAIATWDEARVSAWLKELGVTAGVIAIFAENGIDGKTLLLLHEGHLQELGVGKLGDRLKLNSALEKIRNSGSRAAATSPLSANNDLPVSQPSNQLSPDSEEQLHVRNVTTMVVKNLEELFAVFANDDFVALPREQQLSLIAKAETSFKTILQAIARLPAEHQQRLLAFADNFGSLLTEVKKAFGSDIGVTSPREAAASKPSTADALPEAASAAAVQQIIPLLKQFHDALESPAMVAAPLAQRKELCDSIIGQVTRMKGMADRLHPSHAASLNSICDRILKIANTRMHLADEAPAPPPRGVAPHPSAASGASEDVTPQLLSRLRALFEVLRNPSFLDSLSVKDPKEIRVIVARMRGEINEISEEAEAKITDHEQRKLIGGVIENVLSILSQVSMLGATKVENDGTPITPRPQDPEMDGESPPKRETSASVRSQMDEAERANQVANRLKAVLRHLEDPANRTEQHTMVLIEELSACRKEIDTLPAETKVPLSQLLAKIVEVFQMSRSAKGAAVTSESDASPQDDEEEDFIPSYAFNKIKENLESVFTALNSDEFQQGERHNQNRFCQRLLGLLRQIDGEIETKITEPAEQDSLSQLSASLTTLVERMIEGTATPTPSPTGPKAKSPAANAATAPRIPITPQEAIEKIQTIKNILTTKFGDLQPKDQLKLANGMLADLKDVEAKITAACSLSAADRTAVPLEYVSLYQKQIVPIVLQMKSAVESLVIGLTGSTRADAAVGADDNDGDYQDERFEEESAEEDEDEDDFQADPRKGLFNTVKRATELIQTGRINTIADVKECMGLLQDVDKVGVTTTEEAEVRNEFMIAIRDLTQKMRAKNDAALKTKQSVLNGDEDSDDDEEPSASAAPTKGSVARPKAIAVLIAKMKLILEDIEYRSDKFNSLSELLPYMTAVESMLGKLDEEEGDDGAPLSWKSDPEAVEVVSETLSRIQDIQESIAAKTADGEREPSEMEEMLSSYRDMLEEGFAEGTITDRAHLAPFMEVVHQTHDVEGLTIEESQELMRLQKSILAVSEQLVASRQSSKATSPNNRNQSPKQAATEVEEQDAEPEEAEDEEDEDPEDQVSAPLANAETSSHLNYNGGVFGDDNTSMTTESAAPQGTNTTGLMPRRLSKGEGEEVEESAKENNAEEEEEAQKDEESKDKADADANEEKKDGDEKKEKQPEQGTDPAEHVPGSLQQEVSLLPRVLERLQAKEFIANTTLFELYAISSIILRLEDSEILKGTELAKLVAMIKTLFTKLLQQYFKKKEDNHSNHNSKKKKNQKPQPKLSKDQEQKESEKHIIDCLHSHFARKATAPVPEQLRNHTKDPQSAMFDLPVRLTGMRSENAAVGEGIIHYTIFSLEESGYGIDDTITGPLLASESAPPAQQGSTPKSQNNAGSGLAIIVGPRGQVASVGMDSEDTSAAELAMLDEILQKRFGYNTRIAISNDLSADEVNDIIADAVHEHIEQLGANATIPSVLVYLHTPSYPRSHPESGMPLPQYSINFPYADGSSLPHRDIVQSVEAAASGETGDEAPIKVAHVMVLHDIGHSLQLLSAIRKDPKDQVLATGHHIAVSLTDGAKSVANASRTWLYNGLFTPLICEMLTVAVDDHNKAHHVKSCALPQRTVLGLCAEDFINYPTMVIAYKEDEAEATKKQSGKKLLPLLPKIGRSVVKDDLALSTIII